MINLGFYVCEHCPACRLALRLGNIAYFHPFVSGSSRNPDAWSRTAIPQSGGLPAILASAAPSWLPTGDGVSHQLTLTWG